MRLENKTAIIVGAGQTPGDTVGNGRATAILFAREGADLLLVDRDADSAAETAALIKKESGESGSGFSPTTRTLQADITKESDCEQIARSCLDEFGKIDILHNNVGIGTGDAGATNLEAKAWDLIIDVNIKGMWMTCKHVLPAMREQHSGVIVNISSLASIASASVLAYKISKAGVNALTQSLAMENARYGIRANAILPGLMDTPMAIESISQARGIPKDGLRAARDAQVPLGKKMGTAWDVAYAALFFASDESKFITGALLPVDGGQAARVG